MPQVFALANHLGNERDTLPPLQALDALSSYRRRKVLTFSDFFEEAQHFSELHPGLGARFIQETSTNRLNNDGHLITRNYVLPTPAPGGSPEHNLTLSNASPSIPFYYPDPQLARRAFLTAACTRLRLVSHGVSISDPRDSSS